MDPVSETPAAIDFRRFRVLPHRRELLAEGRRVELGGRAFDVLMALIEASGAVVDKNTLMNRVWPDRIVEDNSLQAQISALRKAFAADRDLIRTIAGRATNSPARSARSRQILMRKQLRGWLNRRPRHPARRQTSRSRLLS